jgi:predicted ATPase
MINYLVGRNNSGKSTAVKAFMLIQDYLLNQLNNVIKFNRQEIEGLNIATFGNAINNTADADKIRFNLTLDEHTIELVLIQEDRQKDFAYVTQLQVLSKDKTYVLDINYLEKSISFKKTKMDIQQSNLDAKKNIIKDPYKGAYQNT